LQLKGEMSVLIVDDNAINLYMMEELLEALGVMHIHTASNGRMAIDTVSRQSFDLVLMDISMPEMDGYETTQKIRERGYGGRILALTATQISPHGANYKKSGLDGILVKPIDIELLYQALIGKKTS